MQSIRRFLLISLLFAVSFATISTSFWTYNHAIKEIDQLFDGQLVEATHILRRIVTHGTAQGCLSNIPEYLGPTTNSAKKTPTTIIDESYPYYHHRYAIKRAFQVWMDDGTLLIKSSSAPDFPLTNDGQGFSKTIVNNQVWRVFALDVPEYGLKFYVAQLEDIRRKLIRTVAITEVLPLLIVYLLLVLFVWFTVKYGLGQIKRVTNEVKQREDPEKLAPVSLDETPTELRPLIEELNCLFTRLGSAFEREKRFSADAAHELRTPLAIVKTHAQVAMRTDTQAGRDQALTHIISGIDRCTHVVEQLSVLNSLRPDEPINEVEILDLNQLASEAIADLVPYAIEKAQEIGLYAEDNLPTISGNMISIRILLRNLIDNAIRYTPNQGKVDVITTSTPDAVILTVQDNGPGIPVELRKRVLDRFYRQLGTGAAGSGLGLSIVHQITRLHNAKLELGEGPDGKGLRFSVLFPR